MKVIVTGANGFIGLSLVKELIKMEGVQVIALIRKGSEAGSLKAVNVSVVEVDYQSDNLGILFKEMDICIHLIGQMGKYGVSEQQFMYANVALTNKILKICEENNIKQFIFCSTPGVQGFGRRLALEQDKYAPRNMYEKTKAMAEEYIIAFCKNSAIKYTIIRPDFVYGPGDGRRVKLYRNIQNKKFVLTTSGRSFLHPTYISDVVQGFIKSMGNVNAYNQIFNISAKEDVTALKYLETIADCVQSKLVRIKIGYTGSIMIATVMETFYKLFLKREAFVTKNKIDFLALDHSTSHEKAKKFLGYRPEVDITEGMKRTIAWCREEKLLN